MAPTVLTLGYLIGDQLVSSEVVRCPDAARAIPFYVLTDKGAAVAARLIATEISDATVRRGHEPSSR